MIRHRPPHPRKPVFPPAVIPPPPLEIEVRGSILISFTGIADPDVSQNYFTPPLIKDRPPYLPDSDYAQRTLWRHFENRERGVNVFLLSNGTYVQDTAIEGLNVNTNIPYPWDPNNPSGPYAYGTNWDGTTYSVSHPVWIVKEYFGGSPNPITTTEVANLTAAGYAPYLSES